MDLAAGFFHGFEAEFFNEPVNECFVCLVDALDLEACSIQLRIESVLLTPYAA